MWPSVVFLPEDVSLSSLSSLIEELQRKICLELFQLGLAFAVACLMFLEAALEAARSFLLALVELMPLALEEAFY